VVIARKKTKKRKDSDSNRRAAGALEPLPARSLRWRCDPKKFPFESTAELTPPRGVDGVVGQDAAIEALKYGLETQAPGQNIFVRGLHGTGRLTLLTRLLQEIRLECPLAKDCCYVHNFQQPDHPFFVALPPGHGRSFKRSIDHLAQFIRHNLKEALDSEGVRARRAALEAAAKAKVGRVVNPFEESLRQAGMRLVSYQAGPITQTAIFPTHQEQPVPPEEYEQLLRDGKVPEEQYRAFKERIDGFEHTLGEVNTQVSEIRKRHVQAVEELLEKSARFILAELVREIDSQFPHERVQKYLQDLVDDVVKHLDDEEEAEDFTHLYRVNLVLERDNGACCPTVAENAPSIRNLLGTIEYEYGPGDRKSVV